MPSRVKWLIAGLAAFAVGWTIGLAHGQPTQLVFVSVGQGDCAVFHHEGYTILIDDGPQTPYSDAGERIVVPELRRLGIDSVDLILLSHPDWDHIGGTGAVLNAFPDARIAMSDEFRNDEGLMGHFQKWNLNPDRVIWLPERSTFQLGEFKATLECPRIPAGAETNDGSMFVHLVDGSASAVFSGDAPKHTEREEEPLEDWRSEIMKAGHHGSRTATDESWIEAVRPTYAIISVGSDNRYGHPNHEVLDRLRQDRVQTFRTDRDGSVEFELKDGMFVRSNF